MRAEDTERHSFSYSDSLRGPHGEQQVVMVGILYHTSANLSSHESSCTQVSGRSYVRDVSA